MRIVWSAVLVVLALRQLPADPLTLAAETSVFSQYVWRGMVPTDGPVLQNSVTTQWRGAHLNIWTNQDLSSVNGRQWKFDELDFDAGYDRSLKKAVFSAGAIHYTFPNTRAAAATELYAGAALAVPLRPTVKAFFDVDNTHGAYLTSDVSHAVTLPSLGESVEWRVELAAGAGWGSSSYSLSWFGVREPGWIDFHPNVAVPFLFGKHWRLTPHLSYSALARSDLRQTGVPCAHGFVAGLALGFAR